MNPYFVRRLLYSVPTILCISFILFALISLAPIDPLAEFAADPNVPPEVQENIRISLGLDQPWPIRYAKWLFQIITRGDFGFSFASRVPVSSLIIERLPTTIWVVGIAYLSSILLAIPIGIICAVNRFSLFDNIISTFTYVGFSMPTFFTGVLFIIIFGVKLQWFGWIYDSTLRVTDFDSFLKLLHQSFLPIFILGLIQLATLTRYVRVSMIEHLSLDYVRTAHAKGIHRQAVYFRHVLRNSLIPVVTLIALEIPAIFTGSIVLEQIFRVPGIGSLLVSSFRAGDTPVIMAITFIYSILVVMFSIIGDFMYTTLDPRIRYS